MNPEHFGITKLVYKSLMMVLFVIFQGKLDISHNNAFQALSAPKKKYSQNDNIFSLCKGIPFSEETNATMKIDWFYSV
jgi:hypothetical protein